MRRRRKTNKSSQPPQLLLSTASGGVGQLVLESNAKTDKRIDYAIVISICLHILLFFLFTRAQKAQRDYADINQVTFIDQTYRPQVAKILPKSPVPAGSESGNEKGLVPETPTLVGSEPVSSIDLSNKLDRSQAQIDLNRYEIDRTNSQLDVIRIGNQSDGKSTEEILLEKPVQLSKGLGHGTGVPGLTGYPGVAVYEEPQIQIEHKSLEKPKVQIVPEKTKIEVQEPISTEPVHGTNISIAGPISQRLILSKVLPQYPEWALTRGISGIVIIRIWVMPGGEVKESITIEQSSGYPEFDQLVVNALRRWKFAPLDKSVVQEVQWGVITFRFCLT
jgi:TonB family protein